MVAKLANVFNCCFIYQSWKST